MDETEQISQSESAPESGEISSAKTNNTTTRRTKIYSNIFRSDPKITAIVQTQSSIISGLRKQIDALKIESSYLNTALRTQTQTINGLQQFVGVLRNEVSGLNNSLKSAVTLINTDSIIDRSQERREQREQQRSAEMGLRRGRESIVERSIQKSLIKPIQSSSRDTSKSLNSLSNIFKTLFFGWLAISTINIFKSLSGDNTTSLKNIIDGVGNKIKDSLKIFKDIFDGTTTITTIIDNIKKLINKSIIETPILKQVFDSILKFMGVDVEEKTEPDKTGTGTGTDNKTGTGTGTDNKTGTGTGTDNKTGTGTGTDNKTGTGPISIEVVPFDPKKPKNPKNKQPPPVSTEPKKKSEPTPEMVLKFEQAWKYRKDPLARGRIESAWDKMSFEEKNQAIEWAESTGKDWTQMNLPPPTKKTTVSPISSMMNSGTPVASSNSPAEVASSNNMDSPLEPSDTSSYYTNIASTSIQNQNQKPIEDSKTDGGIGKMISLINISPLSLSTENISIGPPSEQKPNIIYKRIASSKQSSTGGISPTTGQANQIPIISASNADNFLSLNSRVNYGVVI